MIPDTTANRRFMQAVILFFRTWGHLCLSYTIVNLWRFHSDILANVTPWRLYCAAEAAFLLFFVWYRRVLQRPAVHPPTHSKEERQALFNKVYSEIHDPVAFLRGWFKGAEIRDIGLKELQEFLIWSFWNGRTEEVDEEELEEYVDRVRQLVPQLSFREGSGNATGLRLTIDDFEIDYRTLMWYGIIMAADTITFAIFLSRGYRYYGTTINGFSVFPPRPGSLASSDYSVSEQASYWVTRPHTSKTRLPILYFHGIGIGLITYAGWIAKLDAELNAGRDADDQVGILLIEVPQISSRLTYRSIPPPHELVSAFTAILDANNYDRFVLAGHSYGSIMSTYVLRDEKLSERVASALLVDPVAIMLHMPDVAFNFTIRPPVRANEWQLWFFASKDPGVAHTLGRNFFWFENVLWRDTIYDLVKQNKLNLTVSLGSDDLIVNAEAVGRYLMEGAIPDPVIVEDSEGEEKMRLEASGVSDEWKTKKWSGKGIEMLWWPGFDHATVYEQDASSEELIRVLVEYSRNS